MNNSKQDILNNLIKEPFINQRILAAQTGHSLGIVNRSLKELISEGYLDEETRPTEKALREAKEKAPKKTEGGGGENEAGKNCIDGRPSYRKIAYRPLCRFFTKKSRVAKLRSVR